MSHARVSAEGTINIVIFVFLRRAREDAVDAAVVVLRHARTSAVDAVVVVS